MADLPSSVASTERVLSPPADLQRERKKATRLRCLNQRQLPILPIFSVGAKEFDIADEKMASPVDAVINPLNRPKRTI